MGIAARPIARIKSAPRASAPSASAAGAQTFSERLAPRLRCATLLAALAAAPRQHVARVRARLLGDVDAAQHARDFIDALRRAQAS